MRRFYYDFIPEEQVRFEGEQFIHLAFVLRAKNGDRITLIRNDEYDYIYEIIDIEKKFAELKFIEKIPNKCNPCLYVRLFAALEKGDKMEFVVQKAVELGVSEIVPIKTAFSQVKPESIRIERLQKIANEACKQCGRSKSAKISDVVVFEKMNIENTDSDLVCFLYEGKCEYDLLDYLRKQDHSKIKRVDIIIGSEGGFSEKEAEFLNRRKIPSLTLGARILRAETACVAACSVIMAEMGELR